MSETPTTAELRRLIRASRVFDDVLKRSWLNALPLMAPPHRAELAEILALEQNSKSMVPSPPGRGTG